MATFLTRIEGTEASVVAATADEYTTSVLRVRPPINIEQDTLIAIRAVTGVKINQLAVGSTASIYECTVVESDVSSQFDTKKSQVQEAVIKIATIAAFTDNEAFFLEQHKS